MRKIGLDIILCMTWAAVSCVAQTPAPAAPNAPKQERAQVVQSKAEKEAEQPTPSDMYCSGFITPQPVPRGQYIAGGFASPHQTHFGDRNLVYLSGGGFEAGQQYAVIRPVRDTNSYEPFNGQKKLVATIGKTYQELGRIKINEIQNKIAIATVEFSCDGMIPGDLVLPWAEKPAPTFRRRVTLNPLATPNGKLTGRIIAAKDFDMIASSKSKIYLNVGANQGVKPGDYFRATRDYASEQREGIDALSYKASISDARQYNAPKFAKERYSELPRRTVADMIVLFTTPTTATAMVTQSLQQVQIGDMIELMDELPPLPPPPPPLMNPPTITCSASPATIRVGENSNIRCTGASPDDRPLTYAFVSDNGALAPNQNAAVLDGKDARPGVAQVTAVVTDDRNLSASAVTPVTIEAAPVIESSRLGEFNFRPNSAYVDNRAKAFLDTVALRLQREANSSAMVVGYIAPKESARLGSSRASNANAYLIKEKGIDGGRLQSRDAGAGGNKAEVWFVPAGATMPNIQAAPAPTAPVAAPTKAKTKAGSKTKAAAKPASPKTN